MVEQFEMPKGEYLIGDPCILLPDKIYNYWGIQKCGRDGSYFVDGHYFCCIGVGDDGFYGTSDPNIEYSTDSGTLAVVNAKLVDPSKLDKMMTFCTHHRFIVPVIVARIRNTLMIHSGKFYRYIYI